MPEGFYNTRQTGKIKQMILDNIFASHLVHKKCISFGDYCLPRLFHGLCMHVYVHIHLQRYANTPGTNMTVHSDSILMTSTKKQDSNMETFNTSGT